MVSIVVNPLRSPGTAAKTSLHTSDALLCGTLLCNPGTLLCNPGTSLPGTSLHSLKPSVASSRSLSSHKHSRHGIHKNDSSRIHICMMDCKCAPPTITYQRRRVLRPPAKQKLSRYLCNNIAEVPAQVSSVSRVSRIYNFKHKCCRFKFLSRCDR
jgi:hypothetical protein